MTVVMSFNDDDNDKMQYLPLQNKSIKTEYGMQDKKKGKDI